MIKIPLELTNENTEKVAVFGKAVLNGFLVPAFGARSKPEIDLLVFSALIEARLIDHQAPLYELARFLNITPARTRSLVLNWQLRNELFRADLTEAVKEALLKTRFAKDVNYLTFGIESPLLKEEVAARLRRRGVFADASFSREIVRLPVDAFVEFLDDLVTEKTKSEFVTRLVEDGRLPDKSFKAIATGALSKLGEKVIGKVADDVVGDIVGFLGSLFKGDSESAAKVTKTILG